MTKQEAIEILNKNAPKSDPRLCALELCSAIHVVTLALQEKDHRCDNCSNGENAEGKKIFEIIEAQPQVGGVEINKDFETILLCAVRYAIGRQTYIPSLVIDYITPLLPYLSEDVLKLIADEIIEHYTYEGALGDEKIDKPYWEQFLRKIRLEMGGRNEK